MGSDTTAQRISRYLDLYDEALPHVYGYVVRRVESNLVAEDVTAETFLSALATLRKGTVADVSVPWLIGVARHKVADHWRRRASDDRRIEVATMEAITAAEIDTNHDTWDVVLDEPRVRFATTLYQQLQEASMTDTPDAIDPASSDTGYSIAATGGASNLFYFTLPAPDLDQSKAFYSRLFGWVIDGGSLGGHIANVTPPGGLMPGAAAEDRSVFITIDDIDAASAKVTELGGSVEGDPSTAGPGTWLSCRDDQGTQFFLQDPWSGEHADYARSPQKGTNHGDLFYFSLPVDDGEAGRQFYSSLFGWDLGEPGSAGGMNARNLIIDGGIGAGRAGDRVELWFRVDDITASVALVDELGGRASEVFDTPQGLIAQCTDDQGVEFGLAQPAAGF